MPSLTLRTFTGHWLAATHDRIFGLSFNDYYEFVQMRKRRRLLIIFYVCVQIFPIQYRFLHAMSNLADIGKMFSFHIDLINLFRTVTCRVGL